MRIDLHTHSAISDGTQSPTELISAAVAAGLDAIALTDHDTVAGWDEADSAAAKFPNFQLLRGIEVSAKQQSSVHILAFGVDGSNESALARRLEEVRDSRAGRLVQMVEKLSADFPISWEMVAQLSGINADGSSQRVVGRPHIADALIQAGVVQNRAEAFAGALATGSKYYVPYDSIAVPEAIELIHAAGGVAVGAHLLSPGRNKVPRSIAEIEGFIAAGLDGVEVFHREHDATARGQLLELAKRHELIVTGGSDYHGAGKENRLGENLTQPAEFEKLLSLIYP